MLLDLPPDQVATGWLSIETAPKDGKVIRAGKMSHLLSVPYMPYPVLTRFDGREWVADFGRAVWTRYEPQPTHWKPA